MVIILKYRRKRYWKNIIYQSLNYIKYTNPELFLMKHMNQVTSV